MREIKFRAIITEVIDKKSKLKVGDFAIGSYDPNWSGIGNYYIYALEHRNIICYKINIETLGEFTNQHGLFEGDIFSNGAATWEVTEDRGCFCGKMIGTKAPGEPHLALRAIQGEITLLGNRYQNPELLTNT